MRHSPRSSDPWHQELYAERPSCLRRVYSVRCERQPDHLFPTVDHRACHFPMPRQFSVPPLQATIFSEICLVIGHLGTFLGLLASSYGALPKHLNKPESALPMTSYEQVLTTVSS